MVFRRGPRQDCLLGQPLKAGSALEADHEAPMPGHLTRGGGPVRVPQEGIPDRGTPIPLATATPARNA